MSSKFNVIPSVRDHFATLVDQHQPNKPYLLDYFSFLGLPALAGICSGLVLWRQHSGLFAIDAFIAGVAIFTGLLFALVIHVFQLRMSFSNDARVPPGGKLTLFIDQLFANVNYAVIVGVVTTGLAMLAAALTPEDHVGPVWSGVLVAFACHLVLTVFMCIRRVRKAYQEIAKLPRTTAV